MKEYIERDAARAELIINDELHSADIVKSIPAADVVEVRHGINTNIEHADCDQFICSECGIELQDWRRVERDCDDGEEYCSEYFFRFCPHCGAKMDGGVNDAAD